MTTTLNATAPNQPPFKPFTPDEVKAITGVEPKVLDAWVKEGLPLYHGEGTVGLTWEETLGVYVGWRWLQEGAGYDRATGVCAYVAGCSLEFIESQIRLGLIFAAPRVMVGPECQFKGMMLKQPPGRIGSALNLKRLLAEFRERLKHTFPKG